MTLHDVEEYYRVELWCERGGKRVVSRMRSSLRLSVRNQPSSASLTLTDMLESELEINQSFYVDLDNFTSLEDG